MSGLKFSVYTEKVFTRITKPSATTVNTYLCVFLSLIIVNSIGLRLPTNLVCNWFKIPSPLINHIPYRSNVKYSLLFGVFLLKHAKFR